MFRIVFGMIRAFNKVILGIILGYSNYFFLNLLEGDKVNKGILSRGVLLRKMLLDKERRYFGLIRF